LQTKAEEEAALREIDKAFKEKENERKRKQVSGGKDATEQFIGHGRGGEV